MRIACIGGGPAGLYFAVLAKQADHRHEIDVYERNRADDTFGFGVVFSDNTLGFLSEQDRSSYPEIIANSRRWDPFTILHRGRTLRCGGVGFSAIERKQLLHILQGQAAAVGVRLHFQSEVPDLVSLAAADLVVAADGGNSGVRERLAEYLEPRIEVGPTRFTWLGTDKGFDSLTFFFEESEHGVFGVHVYPYRSDRSTFIVETDEETWRRAGIETWTEADTIAYCERLFARQLEGHRLLSNRSLWGQFRTVRCRRWHHRNVVLLGDAAHTAHFSVGSGTKMAMEDALALSQALQRLPDQVPAALGAFEEERRPRVEHIQRMAETSFDWWANFRHYVSMPAEQFAFHLLTRSQFRYDTLRPRDPRFLAEVRGAAGTGDLARLAIGQAGTAGASPDGRPGPAQLRSMVAAADGAGAVMSELVAVSREGRTAPDDPTVDDERVVDAWAAIVSELSARGIRAGIQITHAGPRGACRPARLGLDRPLARGWPLLAASPRAYAPGGAVPSQLESTDMARVATDFADAAGRAARAGFEILQLDFGHGRLAGSFISPLTNFREDEYGGSLSNRLRFPLQILDRVRTAWPRDRTLVVAYSATDWQPGGLCLQDAFAAAAAFRAGGADLVTAQGGQTTWRSTPPYGRCFQMLIAGKLRNEAGIPVIASGGIADGDDLKTILLSGRADLCLLDSVRPGSPR